MTGYYFIQIKTRYASTILEDLQKTDNVEVVAAADNNIPEWQKKEVLSR